MDLAAFAANLERREAGLWVARSTSPIHYPETGNALCAEVEDRSFWFLHRNRCVVAAMEAHSPAGWVLDVGGGNGFVSLALEAAGHRAVLLEPGRDGVAMARRRGLTLVVHSTLDDAGFFAESVPAVGMFDVLEHMEDDEAALSEVGRLLRPGGRLYLTVPAYRLLWSSHDEYSRHQRRYSLSALRRLLARTGFRVRFATYLFAPLPLPIFLLRSLPTRLGLRSSSPSLLREELGASDGPLVKLLSAWLRAEAGLIRRGVPVPVGASCLVVAEAGTRS